MLKWLLCQLYLFSTIRVQSPGIAPATFAAQEQTLKNISLLFPAANTPELLRAKVKQIWSLIFLAALFTQPLFVWRVSKASKGRAAPHCTGMKEGISPSLQLCQISAVLLP